MATSHFEDLRIQPEPDAEEAAAIAAVIARYLERENEATRDSLDRWQLAGRVAGQTGVRFRPAARLPTEQWRAAGRMQR